jgi:hypothetical protein
VFRATSPPPPWTLHSCEASWDHFERNFRPGANEAIQAKSLRAGRSSFGNLAVQTPHKSGTRESPFSILYGR